MSDGVARRTEWSGTMYVILGAAYVITGAVWALAMLTGRWLLTGQRRRIMGRATRFSAYLSAAIAAITALSTIALTMVTTRTGAPDYGFAHDVVGLPIPVAIALALGAMYLIDRRGRARGADTS
jgi:hypothetical protein